MEAKRILVVQLADIGDLVLVTPALAALREAQPEAHIALLASSHAAPVVEGTGLVDEILTFDLRDFNATRSFVRPASLARFRELREGNFDTVLYFHHFTLRLGTVKFALIAVATGAKRHIGLENGNGWFLTDHVPDGGFGAKHQAQYWLDLVGQLGADTTPRPAQMPRTSFTLLPTQGKRIVIHAGGGGYNLARRWSPEGFAEVANTLHREFDAQIILVGSLSDDNALVSAMLDTPPVDLTGATTLPQLADVIAQADLFIGADSGVMHVAAAVGTPIVAVFGPTNHDAYGPWMAQSVVVRSAPVCSPCSYVGHGLGLRHGCPARTCLRMVTPAVVVDAARAVLMGERLPPVLQPEWVSPAPGDTESAIAAWMQYGEHGQQVCVDDLEAGHIAQRDPNLRHILDRCALKVTESELLLRQCAAAGWRVFWLGENPDERLNVIGQQEGTASDEEEDGLVQAVNASGAEVLLTQFGTPHGEAWIARNLPRLHVKIALEIG